MRLKVRYLLVGALVGAILICPAMAASPFPDVDENANYAEAVEYLKDVGLMNGDDKGNFNPNKAVTRAEMATIVCRMLVETDGLNTSDRFSDVPITHWANKYIAKAAEFNIVSGYGNGMFGPNDLVTYEQAVTMVIRAAGGEDEANELGGYPDGYIAVANENSLLTGIVSNKGEAFVRKNIAILLYNCLV